MSNLTYKIVHINCSNIQLAELIPISRTLEIALSSPIKAAHSLNQKAFKHMYITFIETIENFDNLYLIMPNTKGI